HPILRVDGVNGDRWRELDAQDRMVSVTGIGDVVLNEQETRQFYLAVSLYSRPSTSRDAALEEGLQKLASEVPKCSVAKVERHRNAASIEWLHNDIAKKTRGWFKQAEDDAPVSDARRVHDRS
ncbi:MAG: hypothetical protein LC776_19705, partial [Acidobacteria bacterium]|nr:hypothetical protein [Acidobacteriota bacterium]